MGLNRRVYPPLHPRLNRVEGVTYGQLRTNSFINAVVLNRTYPTCYEFNCKHYKVPKHLRHLVWECDGTNVPPVQETSKEQWEARLTSPDPGYQLILVYRAL